MREIEFLPPWYAQFLHRRRTVHFQTWVSVMVVFGLALWVLLAERNQRSAEMVSHSLSGQLQQTNAQLAQMQRLESLRRQLRQQAEVLTRLGIHVESGRLIGKLADSMPPSVSLLSLNIDTDEIPVNLSAIERAGLGRGDPRDRPGEHEVRPYDRRLRIKLQGVAPTDVEMATFLTELSQVPFFERVAPTYVRERREAGHVEREFELTFSINLNNPAGG